MRKVLVGVLMGLLASCSKGPSGDTPPGTAPLSDGGLEGPLTDSGPVQHADAGLTWDGGVRVDGGITSDAGAPEHGTWLLENPSPDLDERRAIWADSATTYWTTSMFSQSLSYFDGQRFQSHDLGAAIESIWGRSDNDVWAVGEGIFHWDGQRWTRQWETPERLADVWGTETHVWAVGFSQQLYVHDGKTWTPAPGPAGNLLHVWANAPDNVWVIANDLGVVGKSTLHHFDGKTWTEHLSNNALEIIALHSIWGAGSSDVWVGGMAGDLSTALAHFDGSQWVLEEHPRSINGVYGLWGTSSSNVYAITHEGTVLQRSESGWARVYANSDQNLREARLFDIAGAQSAVFAVGDSGIILNRANASADWRLQQPRGNLGAGTAAIAFGPHDWWRAQGSQIVHETQGLVVPYPLHNTAQVTALWGTSSSRLWATLAEGIILEWAGTEWRPVYDGHAQDPSLTLTAVSGTSNSDVWAVGYSDPPLPQSSWVLHWNGTEWQRIPFALESDLSAVLARSPTEVWVGGPGFTARWDGDTWHELLDSNLGSIRSFWSPGPNELWAVGRGLFRWSGTDWALVGGEAPHSPFVGNSVWGNSPNDVFAVGDYGEAIHWDGQTLSALTLPIRGHFYEVLGVGDRVYILGERGIQLRRN